jgi:hypothetical protein
VELTMIYVPPVPRSHTRAKILDAPFPLHVHPEGI